MNFYQLWDFEYVFSLLVCFLAISFHVEKRRFGWLIDGVCFVALEGVWLLRHYCAIPDAWTILFYFLTFFMIFGTFMAGQKVHWLQALFLATSVLTLQHLSYKANLAITALIGQSFFGSGYYFLSELIVLLFVAGLGYFFFGRRLKNREIRISSNVMLVASFILVLTDIVISFYTQNVLFDHLGKEKVTLCLVHLLSALLCLAGLILLFQNVLTNNLKEENRVLQILFQKDEERYRLAKLTAERVRIKYHDLKHEMSQRELDEDEKKEFEETQSNYQALMFSGNKAVDLVLMEKQFLASKEGCHISAVVDGSLLLFIHSHQIYSMLGNLLDNAIESAKAMPREDERVIKLSVCPYRGNVLLEVENHTLNTPEIVDGLPRTTKVDKENHGYGMKSIKSVVEEYHGNIDIRVKDGLFSVRILFPNQNHPVSASSEKPQP